MECPRCHEPVETDAAFCGNCGQQLTAAEGASGADLAAVPAYALAAPTQHAGEMQSLLVLLAGVTGMIGALFVPLVGLSLGTAGLIMGTVYRRSSPRRRLNTAGLGFAAVATLLALGTWAYAYNHEARLKQQAASPAAANAATAELSTPCYSLSFIDRLNVASRSGSCDVSAFNGNTLNTSTNAYKIYASRAAALNTASFTSLAKQALEKDVKINLPEFTIDTQRVSGFAGSPAYTINASNKSQGVAVVETAVYHPVKSGPNVFILVHAVNGETADLHLVEGQWQWK